MLRSTSHAVLTLALGLSLFLVNANSPWFGVIAGTTLGLGITLLDQALANRRYLRIAYHSLRYFKSRVRVSISYLYRIKVGGEYLLVKGHRFPNFQPVGGVYKILPNSTSILTKYGALGDDLVPIDAASEHDLRLRIPFPHLLGFVRWFESGKDREFGPWREFHEELIATNILPAEHFATINTRFIAREIRPLRYSRYADSKELLIADVFELVPTAEQEKQLLQLKDSTRPEILWATEDRIRRRGAVPRSNQAVRIAETAEWVVDS